MPRKNKDNYADIEHLAELAIKHGGLIFRARGLYGKFTRNAGFTFYSRVARWRKTLTPSHPLSSVYPKRDCQCNSRACINPDACTGHVVHLVIGEPISAGDITNPEGLPISTPEPTAVEDAPEPEPAPDDIDLTSIAKGIKL